MIIVAVTIALAIGLFSYTTISSQASSGTISIEAESGTLSSGAAVATDERASGGKYVNFPNRN